MKLVIATILLVTGLQLFLLGAILLSYKIYLAGEVTKRQLPLTNQQIILECQRLYANSTKEDFKYPTCLKELKGEGEGIRKI